jgi:hypothetical protein
VTIDPSKFLAAIPAALRDPLLETYREIATNFAEHRWSPSELEGGKFCEVVYWICHGFITGTYVASPTKPPNMRADCGALERNSNTGKSGDHSLRILIPRMLPALYDIRNNRSVGHVGGDVNPNLMDAGAVYSMASWILAELVRIFHNVKTDEAEAAVNGLVERKTPLIWSAGTAKRVLDTKMTVVDQTLLLLHQATGWMSEADLLQSTEYSNPSLYRSNVLVRLHKARKIEYDKAGKRAHISPTGSDHVEKTLIAPRMAMKK